MTLFFLLAWSFSHRTNKLVHKKQYLHPRLVIEQAFTMQQLYKKVQSIPSSQLERQCCWKPPLASYLKLNVDGAVFFDNYGVNAKHGVNVPENIQLLAIFRVQQIWSSMGIIKLIVEK